MRKCVLGCPQGITLHKFPQDPEKRKEWLKMINMEDCKLSNLYLCTRHFARRLKGKSRLVWNAVPTRNLLGVDEEDIECFEIDADVENDEIEEPKTAQLPVKRSGILILPTKGKAADNKGKIPFDPLYQPSKIVTKDQVVKHQIKFVNGKAVKVTTTSKKTPHESVLIEENLSSAPSTSKRLATKENVSSPSTSAAAKRPKVAPKAATPPANIIKHHIKIVDGKAYKIHVPEMETNTYAQENETSKNDVSSNPVKSKIDTKTIDAPVRKSARNLAKNVASTSLEKHALDDSLAMVEQDSDAIIEEISEDEFLEMENKNTIKLKQSTSGEGIFVKFEKNEIFDDDDPYVEEEEQQPQLTTGINKDQPVEFGQKIRSTPRQKVGFVECFTNNSTFCLTCFYCGHEFELWDWQQFVDHLFDEHIPKRRPYVRKPKPKLEAGEVEDETNNKKAKTQNNKDEQKQVDIEELLKPKEEEELYEESQDIEMNLNEEDLAAEVIKDDVQNEMQVEDSMQAYSEAAVTEDDEIEVYGEDAWQVDQLDEYEEIEIYEEQEGDNSVMVDDDGNIVEGVQAECEQEQLGEDEVGVGEYEGEYEEDEIIEGDNDPDNVRQAVINFKTTDKSRVLAFLRLLRQQPMLWHPRRYGPPIYDEEMKKFIHLFDETMSPIDFRRSVENLRYQYKRFTPLTPRGRVKLQEDAFLRESIQIIKEIADKLSKPFAFHCDVCSYCFLDENRMLTHKYLKHKIGDLKYICSCGIRFAFEKQKEEHENLHKLKPRFTCELCGTNFIFNRLLRDHMNESHPETQEDPMPYKCSKCDAKFPSILKRAHHMERHKERKYHCDICKQSYATSFRFKHHMKRHQDQLDWICENCGKAFLQRNELNRHRLRVHREGKKCNYCRSYFSNQENLDVHNERYHPNGTNQDRMKKIRSHFNRKYRRIYAKPKVSTKVYKCKVCEKILEDSWDLARHKRETGHDLEQHNCPHCEAVLSSDVTLMGHLRRVHKLTIKTLAELRVHLMEAAILKEDATTPSAYETIEIEADDF